VRFGLLGDPAAVALPSIYFYVRWPLVVANHGTIIHL
jgi:hypothetical protein